MNNEGNSISPLCKTFPKRKITKCILVTWTVIYLICFPFIFWASLWSALVFDNPSMTRLIGGIIICLALCVPFSMLVSIWLMWSKYRKAQYRQARWLWILPFFMFALTLLFTAISVSLLD
jgi:hypothetical protein